MQIMWGIAEIVQESILATCSLPLRFMVRALILGGTGDAVRLAAKLAAFPTVEIVSSLAGRTQQPALPAGAIRSGGFGGADGLADYLSEHKIDVLIDATHPFAAQISWNASLAAAKTGVRYLRLDRPAWQPDLGDRWIEVETIEDAARAIPPEAKRVFLTIGRQQLAPFASLARVWFLMRAIDPPAADLPLPNGTLLLERGPFSLERERQLLRDYQIDAMVSKNSGGAATYPKLVAARELALPVVMVRRPAMPSGDTVADGEGAIAWLAQAFQISER
ncbi:cobalt-precorrin-6A reductase [Altericista sp. CCNU0014]|uniref:cobalt-precorrin-6A reductase n=1 Tax=Altericista sp. CCNU0014 TaxID=3082949 RepID=UPI0038511FDC